jgi:hypothetical protein
LRRVVDLEPQRLLFSHGKEMADPNGAIRQLLDQI